MNPCLAVLARSLIHGVVEYMADVFPNGCVPSYFHHRRYMCCLRIVHTFCQVPCRYGVRAAVTPEPVPTFLQLR